MSIYDPSIEVSTSDIEFLRDARVESGVQLSFIIRLVVGITCGKDYPEPKGVKEKQRNSVFGRGLSSGTDFNNPSFNTPISSTHWSGSDFGKH